MAQIVKFRCGNCGAKYRSEQQFTSERSLNFRCKKCGTRLLLHKRLPQEEGYLIAEVVRSKSQSDTVIAERPTDLDLTRPGKSVSPVHSKIVTPSKVIAPSTSQTPEIPAATEKFSMSKEKTVRAPLSETDRRQLLKNKISDNAAKFEILPLIRALQSIGYSFDDILWRSSRNTASMNSVIESVEFMSPNSAYVRVCLSQGLLGPDSLLPSYFFRMLEKMPDPEPFYQFIHFFDHSLLREYVRALYPQFNTKVIGNWSKVKKSYFGMLGVNSESTLAWFFQLYFPELVVQVKRKGLAVTSDNYAFRTGQSMLDGTGVIGNEYASEAAGFTVQLIAPEELNDNGKIWPLVVRQRLESHVRPLLGQYRLNLNLNVLVSEHATWAGIQDSGFLGYDRIRGKADSGHQVSIHSGPLLPKE